MRLNVFIKEPNGRDEPVAYTDPLDVRDAELIEDVLESDVVAYVQPKAVDELDRELHLEACEACARNAGRLRVCAHCLEEKVCQRVPTQARSTPRYIVTYDLQVVEDAHRVITYQSIELCRRCRNSSQDEALDVID
jgi:hypothetical protein